MNSHLRHDLKQLKDRLPKVAIAVEENVRKSVRAITELSEPLAREVVSADAGIDKMEVDTEEECLKILALHQPVASDLRFVVTVLKINNELEHIGDVAANVAKRAIMLKAQPKIEIPFDLDKMASRTIYMLRSSIDAFLRGDELLAIGVCEDDCMENVLTSWEDGFSTREESWETENGWLHIYVPAENGMVLRAVR